MGKRSREMVELETEINALEDALQVSFVHSSCYIKKIIVRWCKDWSTLS